MWEFWKSKTFWTAVAALCTATGGHLSGELPIQALYAAVFGVFAVIFMRHGIEKSKG